MIVSTTNEIAGYRVVQHLGLVRGVTVRSRSVVGNFFGGITVDLRRPASVYAHLAEVSRQEAFDHMCQHAAEGGANAVLGMRYDATEIMPGITESAGLWRGGPGGARLICPLRAQNGDFRGRAREGTLERRENVLDNSMTLVTTTEELAAVCERLARHPFVTVDTEFLRETTFWPKVCVIQVASPDEAKAIDTLAKGLI